MSKKEKYPQGKIISDMLRKGRKRFAHQSAFQKTMVRCGKVFGQKLPSPLYALRSEGIPNSCTEYVVSRGVPKNFSKSHRPYLVFGQLRGALH